MNKFFFHKKSFLFSLNLLFCLMTYSKTIIVNNNSELDLANRNATAGDTIEIAGGTYNTPIKPQSSGTINSPIIYSNKMGQMVFIYTQGYVLDISNKNYIELRGKDVSGKKGFNLGGLSPVQKGGNLQIISCKRCILNNIRHQFSVADNAGLKIIGDLVKGTYSEDIVISNSEFYFHTNGFNSGTKGAIRDSGTDLQKYFSPNDSGNGFFDGEVKDSNNVRRIYYKNNLISNYGGHSPIAIHGGTRIIFEGNTFINDWSNLVCPCDELA